MSDLFASMMPYMSAALGGNASQSVTATRGSQAIGSGLKATYGQTVFEQDTQAGIIRWESKDFLILAADYTIGGEVVEPKNRDRFVDHNGNTFDALGQDDSPCFRYADPYRTMLRIHTKQVT